MVNGLAFDVGAEVALRSFLDVLPDRVWRHLHPLVGHSLPTNRRRVRFEWFGLVCLLALFLLLFRIVLVRIDLVRQMWRSDRAGSEETVQQVRHRESGHAYAKWRQIKTVLDYVHVDKTGSV